MSNFKISAELLREKGACNSCINWFVRNLRNAEYTVAEIIEKGVKLHYSDVHWAMKNIPALRTEDVIRLYLSLKPNYIDLHIAIKEMPEMRTVDMFKLHLSMRPYYSDIHWMMDGIKTFEHWMADIENNVYYRLKQSYF